MTTTMTSTEMISNITPATEGKKRIQWHPDTNPEKDQSRRRTKRVRLEDLLSLEECHPYGCLPGGNQFMGFGEGDKQQSEKFSIAKSPLLTDELWQQVLSFVDARTLQEVTATSRYFYVAGHQPELWRDLVLRKCSLNAAAQDKRMMDHARYSWKDTYLRMFHRAQESTSTNEGETSMGADPPKLPIHKPMAIPNFYSDEFYRTHRCRSFAIPSRWRTDDLTATSSSDSSPGRVPCVAANDMTAKNFQDDYESKNFPVVIKGAASKTDALERWQDFGYLKRHNASTKSFRATSGAAPLPANFTLDAYQEYAKFNYLEESPLYLFDRTAFDDNEQWRNDFFPEFYKTCPWWDPKGPHCHDLLQYLGDKERPDHTWLIIGPKRSGSVFHIDPNATHAWNVCVKGRKRWIFYPPGTSPPGVFPSADGDEVAVPFSVGEWLMQYWSEHLDRCKSKNVAERPLECTVHPGDAIFVPHGWWHMVVNLDDGENIAITHNYVSPSNLGNVLKFFQDKQDQISGCRDRRESIKPEVLHETFSKALQEREPNLLVKAQSQKGWTCRAWSDKTDGLDMLEAECGHESKGFRVDADQDAPHSTTSLMNKTEKVASFSFSFL